MVMTKAEQNQADVVPEQGEDPAGDEMYLPFNLPGGGQHPDAKLILETGKTLAADGVRANFDDDEEMIWSIAMLKASNPFRTDKQRMFHKAVAAIVTTKSRARKGKAMEQFVDAIKGYMANMFRGRNKGGSRFGGNPFGG